MDDPVRFEVQPAYRFEGQKTKIKAPKEIAYFSYDDERKYHPDCSSLSYYYPPPIPPEGIDLSKGFEKFHQLDDSNDEHLDSLLRTIMDLEKKDGHMCEADVVTWRGMMTKIVTAPYDKFSEFEMNATKFQVINEGSGRFIEEHHIRRDEERNGLRHNGYSGNRFPPEMMSYWVAGYKFETLSVIPNIWDAVSRDTIEGRDEEVVNNYSQYCSVVRTAIGDNSLVIGGEVDAVWDEKPEDADRAINWVELKTTEIFPPNDDRALLKFERKLLRMWAQSFLLNVPRLVIGFRDSGGRLHQIKELETQRIPGIVKRKETIRRQPCPWDAFGCLKFADDVLCWLRREIGEGIWRIRKRKGEGHIELLKLTEEGPGRVLSEEFVQWRRSDEFRSMQQTAAMQ
ncbi:uncharacterized protein K452DRAFT_326208 [Aplosporella prunicola CBS 121167]|uniref:Decapping nuclease n=1 Tax=Aplosporella prunicola CBS 121167 TaxID=1176127 RepID=A0A6A6BG32_9PEZI|nr:uncharacterized protein K452DRAFT_326208 [Aplosporella prunicola CBS 121167]KAF2143026.1 hypothetical protein K452DRAFT_326208 [Aplosporella prunicola CBS 121167]